jgi:hypothetical protein
MFGGNGTIQGKMKTTQDYTDVEPHASLGFLPFANRYNRSEFHVRFLLFSQTRWWMVVTKNTISQQRLRST